ncbi:hypothetical protein N7G274_004773 [Stereocaulon virgatum]|uniref:Uncharacterized protein n=1 Tax=Stereocaulon virgatum TaxID=373712 RepID=A0ABR4AB13_9LECA
MASNHTSLDAAATERKARLAKLASLKRKAPHSEDSEDYVPISTSTSPPSTSTLEPTTTYLSGRNYDPSTRGPKLGFENAPNAEAETLEDRAAAIALETKARDEQERKEDKPIDLFSLQPKKPNWDLKRDVARKMEVLNARTANAIAKLVRERVEGQTRRDVAKNSAQEGGNGEIVGMGGVELVEGVHVRERQEEQEKEEERRRDENSYDELKDA